MSFTPFSKIKPVARDQNSEFSLPILYTPIKPKSTFPRIIEKIISKNRNRSYNSTMITLNDTPGSIFPTELKNSLGGIRKKNSSARGSTSNAFSSSSPTRYGLIKNY